MVRMVKLKEETYDELMEMGKKGETFDDLIRKAIDAYKRRR